MKLSTELKTCLSELKKAGFTVCRGYHFNEYDEKKQNAGHIVYVREPQTINSDNRTQIINEISSIEARLYISAGEDGEEAEDQFFEVLDQCKMGFDVLTFDEYVTEELIRHTFKIY